MPTLDDLDPPRLKQAAKLLERENTKLAKKVIELEARVRTLENKEPTQLELLIAELERQLADRNRRLFGDSSERRAGDEPRKVRRSQRGHGPHVQRELPMLEERHELDAADQTCPSCGKELVAWDGQTEDSDEVDVIERRFVIVKHRRQKYRCTCGACVETAPTAPRLIPGGRYSSRFAVAVAIAKYTDHLPLERQTTMMQRQGLIVTSQTLWDQIEALAAKLEPLYVRLGQYIRSQPVIGADETPWKMLWSRARHSNKRWYAWALCASDAAFYQIEDSRSAEAGARVLGDFAGTAIVDGYSAYPAIQKMLGGRFRIAACHAHARRKFYEIQPLHPAECDEVLDLWAELYGVERETKDLSPDERLDARRTRAGPILKRIQQWALSIRALPESPLAKAIAYLGAMWNGLQVFLDDPNVSLDNNAVERALRAVVVGRKNHYGSKSRRGTEVAALFYSLIESAKICGLMPDDYLQYALDELLAEREPNLPHELVVEQLPLA